MSCDIDRPLISILVVVTMQGYGNICDCVQIPNIYPKKPTVHLEINQVCEENRVSAIINIR